MTASQRFERDLPDLLAELLEGPAPNYRDAVLLETARVRQRPGWSFPERWLPMRAEAAVQSIVPPLPWRALGALALLVVLLIALAFAAGSRERRLPAPFGPARNGLIAFRSDDNIAVIDPLTGNVRVVSADPAIEGAPAFSPDGTRLAWERRREDGDRTVEDIIVAASDGAGAHSITDDPLFGPISSIQWAPDSRSILVGYKAQGKVVVYDAVGSGPALTVFEGYAAPGAFRPPDGREFLARRLAGDGSTLLLVGSDGAPPRELLRIAGDGGPSAGDIHPAAWSPDGAQIALSQWIGNEGERHLFIVNADGSGMQDVYGPPNVVVLRPVWSPDGRHILVEQMAASSDGPAVPPIVILTVADGAIETLDQSPETGMGGLAIWAPDGRSVLVGSRWFDLDTHVWSTVGAVPVDQPTWQRLAP